MHALTDGEPPRARLGPTQQWTSWLVRLPRSRLSARHAGTTSSSEVFLQRRKLRRSTVRSLAPQHRRRYLPPLSRRPPPPPRGRAACRRPRRRRQARSTARRLRDDGRTHCSQAPSGGLEGVPPGPPTRPLRAAALRAAVPGHARPAAADGLAGPVWAPAGAAAGPGLRTRPERQSPGA